VENPAVLPQQAASEATTPVSGSRRSTRILGYDAEPEGFRSIENKNFLTEANKKAKI
jgi:hypothetical protein